MSTLAVPQRRAFLFGYQPLQSRFRRLIADCGITQKRSAAGFAEERQADDLEDLASLEGIEESETSFRLHDGRFGGYAWLPSGAVCSIHYPRLRQHRARAGQCVPNQQVTR